jgi:hypothetical protein
MPTEEIPGTRERLPWLKPVLLLIILLPLFAGGVLVSSWFAMRTEEKKKRALPAPPEDIIALRAENTLLKKMLGQVEGKVAVLGPVSGTTSSPRGKLVWDESLQQGYLHLAGLPVPLPEGQALYLWALTDKGPPQPCARMEPAADGTLSRRFLPPVRLLKVRAFQVTLGDRNGLTNTRTQVLVEGALE